MKDNSSVGIVQQQYQEKMKAQASQQVHEDFAQREKLLEEESIRLGRTNALGKIIRSAEPYNYFQTENAVKPKESYMTRVIGVYLKKDSAWANYDDQLLQLIKVDIGYEDPLEKISSYSMGGKYITLTAKTKEIRREIYNRLTEKYSSKYSCVLFEEQSVHVALHHVPEDMPDDVLREELGRYGKLSSEPIV